MARILVLAVGTNAVRSALHKERVRPAGCVLGHIDRREEALAVAHGNAELILGVVGADVVFPGLLRHRLLGADHGKCKGKNGQNGEEEAERPEHLRQQSPE